MSPQLLVKVKHTDNTQMTQGETLWQTQNILQLYVSPIQECPDPTEGALLEVLPKVGDG